MAKKIASRGKTRTPKPTVPATHGNAPELVFILESVGWKKIPRLKARLQAAAVATAAHLPKKLQIPFTATVLLAENARIRRLNRDFRGIDKVTNVLSFPQFEPAELPKFGKFPVAIEVGDIALAYAYSAKEAKQNNKLMINHIIHLTIHGLLHLFGYDHRVGREADAMERLETKIMKSLALPDPYADMPVLNKQKSLM